MTLRVPVVVTCVWPIVVLGLVAGLLAHVAPDAAAASGLEVVSSTALILTVAVLVLVPLAQWAAAQPVYHVCYWCRESKRASEGFMCAGHRFACGECCAGNSRVTPRPGESAAPAARETEMA